MKTKEKIFDIETNEETIVERDMTSEEIMAYEKAQKDTINALAKQSQAAAAKEKLLEKLGITEEEAKLLF